MKYGGKFEGIIPELLDKYRNTQEHACSGGSSKST